MADTPAVTRVKDISEKLASALDAVAVRQGRLSAKVQGKTAGGQYGTGSGVIRMAGGTLALDGAGLQPRFRGDLAVDQCEVAQRRREVGRFGQP